MDLDTGDWVKIIAAVVGLSYPLLEKLFRSLGRSETSDGELPEPPPAPPPRPAQAAPAPAPVTGVSRKAPAAAVAQGPSAAQVQLAQSLEALAKDATESGEASRHNPALHRFVEVCTRWLPEEAGRLGRQVLGGAHLSREHVAHANWLFVVHQEVQDQLRQRRDPDLLAQLGDADALAEHCYRPVIRFAHAEGLALSTAWPVARLSEFDLSIWTGFASTRLAPIFLPPGFFESVWHWPAVAHEVGHDFLVSVSGLRDRLGEELGLPGEAEGTLPLQLTGNQLQQSELWRVYGGWLEELFCDVFGTLMCGPAYALTMVELFSYEEDPREVIFVPVDRQTGRYDVHPPRHLRVHAVTTLLRRMGFEKDADEVQARWFERNQLDAEAGVPLLFWVGGSYIYLPHSAFEPLTSQVVNRLYEGPFAALNGYGLRDISGLDFGPHAQAESLRVRVALLSGQVPRTRDARVVIGGAVRAVLEARDEHTRILALARQGIPAVGTHERGAPDAYALGAAGARSAGGLALSRQTLTEALILQEVMERPRPGRRRAPRSA